MIIKNTNGKGLAKLMTYLKELNKERVYVGVPRSSNGIRGNAMIAMTHEFGSLANNIPERSFLRSTVLEQADKYARIFATNIPDAIKNGTPAYEAYSKLGTIAMNDVRLKIASGEFAALAPATIKRKKSSKPLVDTGNLRQSINYEIR